MAWVTFTSRAAFDAYQQAACTAGAIPRPGYKASDNKTVQINNQWTLAWADIFGAFNSTSGTFLLANVPDADVATYGLTVAPNTPTFNPNRIVFEGATRTIFSVAKDWLQPKPVTWTDPHDGHIYTVT